MQRKGSVAKISVSPQKGQKPELPQTARVVAGMGMEGDFHWGSPGISMMDANCRAEIEAGNVKGLCIRKYVANIEIEGVDFLALEPGMPVAIADARFEITKVGKRCFDECTVHQGGGHCLLKYNCLFADVVHDGEISLGDDVLIDKVPK